MAVRATRQAKTVKPIQASAEMEVADAGVTGGIKFEVVPAKTAMICIDMQKAFCSPGGEIEAPLAREIAPNINRLADCCRQAKIPVIWVRRIHRRDGADIGMLRYFAPTVVKGDMACAEGTPGIELYEELKPKPGDYWVKKIRYSAFVSGSSDLERMLRGMERDTVIVTGMATNVCCLSTIINAMELDFKAIAVDDCLATFKREQHQEALRLINLYWAQVISSNDLIKEIRTAVKK